jgi:hypothetical protein
MFKLTFAIVNVYLYFHKVAIIYFDTNQRKLFHKTFTDTYIYIHVYTEFSEKEAHTKARKHPAAYLKFLLEI